MEYQASVPWYRLRPLPVKNGEEYSKETDSSRERTDFNDFLSMMLLYSLGLLGAVILASPYWLFRMVWSGRYRDGLGQRLGSIPQTLRNFVRHRSTIWVHAVSVGEVLAASRLVELLDGIDSNLPVVISTTTRTGQDLARQRFNARNRSESGEATETRVFYYPLDFAWIVRRYLRVLRPRVLVLMESELWPRMLVEAECAGIPVVVVNGRVSNRSLPKYRALERLWRPLLRKLSLVLAQSEQDSDRFAAIGVPDASIETAGNLKYDVRATGELEITRELRTHLPEGSRIIVAGSTLEGEENYVLSAFQELLPEIPQLVLILAPRHPERFRAVEQLVQEMKLHCTRRSEWMRNPQPIPFGSIFLLDSIGELSSVYSLGSVAFVGGSLVPVGGHNPLEPAQFSVPIVTGPYVENFRGMVAALLEQEGIRVTPPERLGSVFGELLLSPESARMGARARKVFEENAGASERCLSAIAKLLAESVESSSQEIGRG